MLNKKYQQWGIIHEKLSVDEAMTRYYGHHSSLVRGKPVRFGFKNWSLCSSNGYCYSVDTYCGKTKGNPGDIQQPLGSRVVLSLLKCVCVYPVIIFLSLLSDLKRLGFRATGTLRQNRTEKSPLIPVKEMEKKKRGSYDSAFDSKNELLLIRWNDNSVCTIATNYDFLEPLQNVTRWCKEKK
ncbi:hypothetical protein PPYR_15367 [Photinus pyralis]|uniref:PiggyBac transposable element-derived protein domain-containing protein n=1 Tax=Photinus pyralis TaxID=7054 RepID=A0A5N3ZZ18_PHOPY|nr:hypothetical protein PPYR_15367 [Photinus pyralis]